MHEFTCQRCGIQVVKIMEEPHPENIYCLECQFVLSIDNEEARRQAEEFLKRRNEP